MSQENPPIGGSGAALSDDERATLERLQGEVAKATKTKSLSRSFLDRMTSASVDPAWEDAPHVPRPADGGHDAGAF